MSEAIEAPPRGNWAASSVAPSLDLMVIYQGGLPVRLIATPRKDLQVCEADEPLVDVIRRNQEGFDYFPVRDRSGQIIGLVELPKQGIDEPPRCSVREQMILLCEDNLVGADASILDFVKEADTKSCRLVMSGTGIEGLVTLSDLQKFPVRIALFALVTQAEMTMADAIRREFGDSTGWKDRLSGDRCLEVERKRKEVTSDDNWVDDLLFTEFADKKTIIVKSGLFTASKTAFKKAMEDAEELRNFVAHANDYADTHEAARKVCRTVRAIENWIDWLGKWQPATAAQ